MLFSMVAIGRCRLRLNRTRDYLGQQFWMHLSVFWRHWHREDPWRRSVCLEASFTYDEKG